MGFRRQIQTDDPKYFTMMASSLCVFQGVLLRVIVRQPNQVHVAGDAILANDGKLHVFQRVLRVAARQPNQAHVVGD